MFRRSEENSEIIAFEFEGHMLQGRCGDSVAAALLAAGISRLRDTPVSGAPRGPWCMMGVCFDCLVEIDGIANRQACMTVLVDGMRLRRQSGARKIG